MVGIIVSGLRDRAEVCTPIDTARCGKPFDVLDARRSSGHLGSGGRGSKEGGDVHDGVKR